MINAQIYQDDLTNYFPTYTFNTIITGSLTTFEALNGATVVASAMKGSLEAAVFNVREQLRGGLEVLPRLTTTQRDALTGVQEGTSILNITTNSIEKFEASSWVPDNEVFDGNYTFQGSTKFGGDPSIEPLGRIHVIGTDADGSRVRAIRFQDNAAGSGAFQAGHSRGTEDTRDALVSGDRLGQYLFVGDNGNVEASNGPVMRGITTENWSGTVKGSRTDFYTILNGTTAHNLAFTMSEHGYGQPRSYTVATLPNVGTGGGIIHVSDETGGPVNAESDGTNWRRTSDGAIVA